MNPAQIPASLWRRLAAMSYDLLCVFGLLLAATQLAILAHHGKAFNGEWWFQLYLFSVIALYFIWFWKNYGQTIGMRAWSLSLTSADGKPISFLQAGARFLAASFSICFFGIGIISSLWDKNSATFYDKLTKTQLKQVFLS